MRNTSMVFITREFAFDAGHRVVGHEGQCACLHGHRYTALVTFTSPELDKLGRVIDFGVVKDLIGHWIDMNWDHNMLLHSQDPLMLEANKQKDRAEFIARIFGKQPYIMGEENPTAENIARKLLSISQHLLLTTYSTVKVTNVRIYETPKCMADAVPLPPRKGVV